MRTLTVELHLTSEEIRYRMKEATTVSEFKRWQIIHLALQKKESKEIASTVGMTTGVVKQYIYIYNHAGPEGYTPSSRGGRRFGLLSLEKERELLKLCESRASVGSVITASSLRDTFDKEVGKSVSIFYLYDVLHRHGWRKITPRPRHPKADTKIQEEFKKKYTSND